MDRSTSGLSRVEIDLAALGRNYLRLADAAAPGACAAVVKANAYGLGIEPVARKLRDVGCRHFFVATPCEGFGLRELLADDEDIFLFDGVAGAAPRELAAARLIPVLNSLVDFEAWAGAGPAAVQIDTGMCRLGLEPRDIVALRQSGGAPETDIRYVLTHLACADEPEHMMNPRQLDAFEEARTLWPKARTSIGNSAGTILGGDYRSDLARPGIAIYGGNPFRKLDPVSEPVVTVKARVLQIREVEAGATVGYGASFVAESRMRVATIAHGYADGYPRSLGNCGVIAVADRRVPVVGRVSMDLVCADVSALSPDDVAVGDWATMIGGEVPIDEVATYAGTISYELLTSLGSRLERVYLDERAERMEQLA
jgi:alanine racemase